MTRIGARDVIQNHKRVIRDGRCSEWLGSKLSP
jgi:hypothetical protein